MVRLKVIDCCTQMRLKTAKNTTKKLKHGAFMINTGTSHTLGILLVRLIVPSFPAKNSLNCNNTYTKQMKTKAQTCIHNANRDANRNALPHCTFLSELNLTLPPNMYIEMSSATNDSTCSKCKCYRHYQECKVIIE